MIFCTGNKRKCREYKELYENLKEYQSEFKKQLSKLEQSVSKYIGGRPNMDGASIPEDVFSVVEPKFKRKINEIVENQNKYYNQFSQAIDMAYQRYKHYSILVAEEERKIEEERRINRMRIQNEHNKRGHRR